MVIDVPYISQLTDIQDLYWTNRACGAVSLAMVLAYHGAPIIDLHGFLTTAKEKGGFTQEDGWFYVYLEKAAKEKGFDASFREGISTEQLLAPLRDGNPVIVSVVKRLFGKERGHILVLTGFEMARDEIKGFYYNDPESLYERTGKGQFVLLDDFEADWKKRALFITTEKPK
jgi:Peptidase_C39 like family